VTTTIVEWAESPYGFYVDRHWRGGRWELVDGPIRLADYHADILRHVFALGDDGRLPYDLVAWCEPAKSGKSAIAGLVAEYAALHLDGDVILASNKRNQAASLMFGSLTDSIERNPHLPNVEPGRYSVEFANGNEVRAIPSNSRGEAGARFSLAVFDELWGYVYRDAVRLFDEFKTDPTRQASLKLAVGYAGFANESDLWLDLLEGGLAGEPVEELAEIGDGRGAPSCWRNGRTFVFWSHICRQPWQTAAWIEGQRWTLRPNQFARMIDTDFAGSETVFIEPAAWAACIDPEHKPLPRGSRRPVYVGLDLATKPGGDDCALVGVYRDEGKVKLAFHKVWKGGKARRRELRLSGTVEPYSRRLRESYNLAGLWFDPYQALKLAEDLRAAGIRCHEVQQTHASRGPRDTALYEMAASGELVLYADPDVKACAVHAGARELGNGLIFLGKAGRGKIDLLIALSNCASEARRPRRGGWIGVIRSDLSGGYVLGEEGGVRPVGALARGPKFGKAGRALVDRVERITSDIL